MALTNIFKFILLSYFLCSVYINAETLDSSVLWCRFCTVAVGHTSAIFNILSPGAIKVEQRYMFGKNITVQKLVNPFRFVFEVITTENATCAALEPRFNGRRSWFPGYSWRVCKCPRCSAQLGWTFERELTNDVDDITVNKTFHALMIRSLLGLTEDDDTGEGMLRYLRYSKPFKTSSSLPLIRLRATDDTMSTRENALTSLLPKIARKETNVTRVTEPYNMIKGYVAVPTKTQNVTTIGIRFTQTISETITTSANTRTSVI